MSAKVCERPCSNCPFRRDSMRGYMGNYDDVKHFHDVHIQADEPNPCHMTMDYSKTDWNEKFQAGEMGKQCVGQAIFYKNQCKSPRRPGIPTDVEADTTTIFQWTPEFMDYHTKGKNE